MNAAIIIAGGVGNRMHMDIPKQFINIYDKPVIIYTLEGFQRHPEIDQIGVVCLEGWQETLRRYAGNTASPSFAGLKPGAKPARNPSATACIGSGKPWRTTTSPWCTTAFAPWWIPRCFRT